MDTQTMSPAKSIAAAKVDHSGGVSVTIPVLGIRPSYFAFASIESQGNSAAIKSVAPGTDEIVITFTADPGVSVITYFVATGASSMI